MIGVASAGGVTATERDLDMLRERTYKSCAQVAAKKNDRPSE